MLKYWALDELTRPKFMSNSLRGRFLSSWTVGALAKVLLLSTAERTIKPSSIHLKRLRVSFPSLLPSYRVS